jgi:hypothetical protein
VEEGERDRLVKVLRMFGSDHDGEVAAAARRAHLILQKHALDWDDLVIPVSQAKTRTDSRHQREREELVEWGRLTERQRAVLDRIGNKLKLRGCW